MRVPVDEPGGDDQPVGIDRLRRAGTDPADLDNAAVPDPDIGAIARHSRSIHHRAVFD
jgi:hypothetical protein